MLGLLTPFGGAGVVGTMAVAWIANHWKNGFFIFNKGEGYEYVMTLLLCGVALGTVGPGEWSLDDALEINDDLTGTTGLLLSLVAGGAGALLLLAVFWRPRNAAHKSSVSDTLRVSDTRFRAFAVEGSLQDPQHVIVCDRAWVDRDLGRRRVGGAG